MCCDCGALGANLATPGPVLLRIREEFERVVLPVEPRNLETPCTERLQPVFGSHEVVQQHRPPLLRATHLRSMARDTVAWTADSFAPLPSALGGLGVAQHEDAIDAREFIDAENLVVLDASFRKAEREFDERMQAVS